jgi:DNA-binding MarR family transcriptional regulator
MGELAANLRRDRRAFKALLLALQPLTELRSIPLPLQLVTTFLAIASDEGKYASWYSQQLDIQRFVVARYIHELGNHNRKGEPGFGLIRFEEHPNRTSNRQLIFLTDKGRALAAEMLRRARGRQFLEAPRAAVPVIAELQAAGTTSLQAIADVLNERRIPTVRGGRWHAMQVSRLLKRHAAARIGARGQARSG